MTNHRHMPGSRTYRFRFKYVDTGALYIGAHGVHSGTMSDVVEHPTRVFDLFQEAATRPRCPWRLEDSDVIFTDGTMLDDWGVCRIRLDAVGIKPGGMSDVYNYTVTIAVPPSARY